MNKFYYTVLLRRGSFKKFLFNLIFDFLQPIQIVNTVQAVFPAALPANRSVAFVPGVQGYSAVDFKHKTGLGFVALLAYGKQFGYIKQKEYGDS
jgi:hypothetical protein